MAKFPLYQWKKAGEGSSSIDTQNFASKIKANTFTQKNVFKNTGDIVSIQRTDNQSFGIDFKDESGERLAFIGTSQSDTGKATVWGVSGLKLQTTNSPIEIASGNQITTYTTTNNTAAPDRNRREVLVRKDLDYVLLKSFTNTTVTGNNGYQTAEAVVNGLTTGLNEFYVVMTVSGVDIGYEVQIQVNNLNYPNQSDVKIITTSNWTTSNVDNIPFIYIGWVIYSNNKIRYRMKNTHTSNITFSRISVYKRITTKITGS